AVVADVAEAVAEINGTLIRLVHRPAAKLAHDAVERVLAADVFRVESGEILREALADPLLVVVAPADGLPPPLVRYLVRDEELRKVVERRRIVPPRQLRRRQRLI